MKKFVATLAFLLVTTSVFGAEPGFVSLWDGKTFDGWKQATENADSIRIEDGAIVTNGHTYPS